MIKLRGGSSLHAGGYTEEEESSGLVQLVETKAAEEDDGETELKLSL